MGSRGSDGDDSQSQSFSAGSDDCAAFSGGGIRIRVYPNTCNSNECCTCHADNDGVAVTIDGYTGGTGKQGGNGGKGGIGGNGGQVYIVKVDVSEPSILPGTPGSGGDGGAARAGGLGGKYGDKVVVTVDDVSGGNGKVCKELNRRYDRDNRVGPTGNGGSAGTQGERGSQKSVLFTDYKNYVTKFLPETEALKTNEFSRERILTFLHYFKEHSSIPH